MTTLQSWLAAQANPQIPVNENFGALGYAGVYAKNNLMSIGLTWAYYGGRWSGFVVAAGTLALTDDATNYIVANRASGAISVSTADTNWNDADGYARIFKVPTASGAVVAASVEDWRAGDGGIFGSTGPVASTSLAALTDVDLSSSPLPVDGWVLTYDTSVSPPVWRAQPASGGVQCIPVACSDETTNLTTGTAKVTFRMPYAFTLSEVRASLTTAQASGSIFTVDINENGTSILSTKLTIDNTEKTSTTAATPAVISDPNLADDAEITIDIDQIGTAGARGLKVYLIGTKA